MRRCDDATIMRWGVDYIDRQDEGSSRSSRSSGRAASTRGPATSCPSRYKRALPRLKPRPRCAGSAAGAALLAACCLLLHCCSVLLLLLLLLLSFSRRSGL